MASMLFLLLTLLPQVVPLAFLAAATTGLRVPLTHIDSGSPFTPTERLHRAVQRSLRRMEALKLTNHPTPRPRNVQNTLQWSDFEYVMPLAIGTPKHPVTAILDTGSDLIWTQCMPCFECEAQPFPYYDPTNSSTFSLLPCSSPSCSGLGTPSPCTFNLCPYFQQYGDLTTTQGLLATETLTFSGTPVAGLTFGCGMVNNGTLSNSTGIVGMGRGSLSLPSQLRPRQFSYCLTPFLSSSTGHLFLGPMAKLKGHGGAVNSTPFLSTPYSSFYYLLLHGISFGRTRLPIPSSEFRLKPDGSDGLIIDSGTTLTMLHPAAYDVVKKHVISAAHLPVAPANSTEDVRKIGIDLCLASTAGSPPKMPDMVFHFEGADMVFPRDKYMVWDDDDGLFCLMMIGANGTSILGNYMQQDMHILYDLKLNVMSFAPAKCDEL